MKLNHSIRLPLAAACLTIALMLIVVPGCARDPQQVDVSSGAPREIGTGEPPLIARGQTEVADLPVPVGFSYQESDSRAQVSGDLRYVSVHYKGHKSKERVARFYREQMTANHRWTFESFRNDQGTLKLDFAKGRERCNVVVYEDFWGSCYIHAEIYRVEPATRAP